MEKTFTLVTSAAQWSAIQERLSKLYVDVTFLVDGHTVCVQRRFASEAKSELAVFIDGYIQGAWTSPDKESGDHHEIVKKVWRRCEIFLLSKQKQGKLVESWKKDRYSKKEIDALKTLYNFEKSTVFYSPSFASSKTLVRQFRKIENIQVDW